MGILFVFNGIKLRCLICSCIMHCQSKVRTPGLNVRATMADNKVFVVQKDRVCNNVYVFSLGYNALFWFGCVDVCGEKAMLIKKKCGRYRAF